MISCSERGTPSRRIRCSCSDAHLAAIGSNVSKCLSRNPMPKNKQALSQLYGGGPRAKRAGLGKPGTCINSRPLGNAVKQAPVATRLRQATARLHIKQRILM